MLTVKYRNVRIVFNDHTDLLMNKEDLDKLFGRLDFILDRVKIKYDKGLYKDSNIVFVRLRDYDNLSVYVGIGKDKNPYLFVYNSKEKTVTDDIKYESFKMLENDIVMGDLEDKINNLGNDKYKHVIPRDIFDSVEKYLSEK